MVGFDIYCFYFELAPRWWFASSNANFAIELKYIVSIYLWDIEYNFMEVHKYAFV